MPELPEVETTRRGIEPHIIGQKISAINVHNPRLRWPVPEAALQQLVGQKITQVQRRAKYLKLYTDTGYILLHLGMSGGLRVVDRGAPLAKHDHIEWSFANNKVLRFHDPRRFGCCLWQDQAAGEHSLLRALGPEPLTDAFNAQYVYQLSRGKKQAVKVWLMNNAVVVGVGNIYASESLFKAGISPTRAAGDVSLAKYKRLVEQVKITLSEAIEQGGTTLKDFLNSEGKPGYFQQQLLVYGRTDEKCVQCASPIKCIKLAQRSSYYCGQCQK